MIDRNELLKGKKAVIFDLDGTLVDSMWMWEQIDIDYLGRFGIKVPPTLQRDIEGMSFMETAMHFRERFSLNDSLEQIMADWNRMALETYSTRVPLKPGAAQFLKQLKGMGYLLGIATSNSGELARAALRANRIEDYFDCVRTACEVKAGKPAPDIYLSVAGTFGVSTRECLVFEDVPMGILAGKHAGMTVCAVEDAFSLHRKEEILGMADYYITDYRDIS